MGKPAGFRRAKATFGQANCVESTGMKPDGFPDTDRLILYYCATGKSGTAAGGTAVESAGAG